VLLQLPPLNHGGSPHNRAIRNNAGALGKNLYTTLYDVYAHQSRFCIIVVSNAYRDKMWTNHERSAAQVRALESRGDDYILPIRLEDATIPGLPPTVAYLPVELGIEEIADVFTRKLASVS
jgi:hypothetical protein